MSSIFDDQFKEIHERIKLLNQALDYRYRAIKACIVLAGIAVVLMVLLFTLAARADETGEPPCVPTVSDYDTAYAAQRGEFAVVWWCTEADGLRAYWWTDTMAKSNPEHVIRLASMDPMKFVEVLSRRWSTVEQITLAMELQAEHGPRCYAEAIPVSCNRWQMLDGQRMCEASGQIQADGSRLPAGSWLACELRKAPAGGWQ